MHGFVLIIFLLALPLVEIWLLLLIGASSSLNTIFILCGVTAAAGWWLMRGEDFSLWTLIETEVQNHRLPTEEILNDFVVWGCGLLLVVPGLLSDGTAVALLLPVVRQELIKWLREIMRDRLEFKLSQ